jgi:hypothetical protein
VQKIGQNTYWLLAIDRLDLQHTKQKIEQYEKNYADYAT